MRTQTNHEPSAHLAADHALRAAHLLQEAPTLLRADTTLSPAQMAKRASDSLLRLPEVEWLTGLRRSTIYEQIRRGILPHSVRMPCNRGSRSA